MRTPIIIVNFKAYSEALGSASLGLARMCAKVAEETGASIAIAPAMPDLALVAANVGIPVLAQHLDPIEAGSKTGWTPIEAVKRAGALGTLLNHSERKMPMEHVRLAVKMCREARIETVVCADTIEEAESAAMVHPDYVAIEPPELIGGDVSVTSAKPDVVAKAVSAVRKADSGVKVLCGAGVKSREDVSMALKLGTNGVLLASGIVRASDPRTALFDLAQGLVRS